MLQKIYQKLPWMLKRIARIAYQEYKMREFYKIQKFANGMMPAEVYKSIFDAAKNAPGGNMIEIGAAHGASTISLGLGLSHNNTDYRIYTFEKGEGGSRSKYGPKNKNISILRKNIQKFGLNDKVSVIPKRFSEESHVTETIEKNAPFSLICIDADGKILRDFDLLYEYLVPGSMIIIDDYSPNRSYTERSDRYPLGGGKQYRTFCYTNYLINQGYIIKWKVIEDTFFGVKPPIQKEINIDEEELNNIQNHLESDRKRSS